MKTKVKSLQKIVAGTKERPKVELCTIERCFPPDSHCALYLEQRQDSERGHFPFSPRESLQN